ncbi:MAG TPA: tRNA (adenosine(37)-N6)-dimethylallyltransferase MiaA [Myxococcota bacterium]|nr:tRNA (adenosine(37)-N6)-dimethylallyltransferase MiaA [Myxococcota bacterium]
MVPKDLSRLPSVVVICGPTGSGKGELARDLAGRLGAEIVSADSRKIFRGFDVGTAKPRIEQRRAVRHHLIDCCDPDEYFSAARFATMAAAVIDDIRARGRLPIVCGGTGLYIRALLHGIVDTPARDEAVRARLLGEEAESPGCLHRRLLKVDSRSAMRLPPSDLVRLVRALEVYEISGQPLSAIQASHGFESTGYRALQAAPLFERRQLYARIEERVDRMLSAGWLEEVRALIDSGLADCRTFETVGYRELREHVAGRISFGEAVERIKRAHRRYARSQMVWFKAVKEIKWLSAPVDVEAFAREVRDFLRYSI